MASSTDVSTQITQALQVTQPDLDTSIGTPVRKMIDAVSIAIAGAYIDQYFLDYQYDVTSLTGTALDDFVNIFGMTRFLATRANGVVTFTRPTAATVPIAVMAGSAVSTTDSPPIVFTTITTVVMPIGSVSIDVPVIAQVGGAAGNVLAGAITAFQTQISGIANFSNLVATTGGADAESDEALITRFQNTVFRNLAGTEPQYLGTALENPNTTAANVVGPYKVYREQVQMVGGIAQSSVQSAQYIWNNNFVFGTNIDSGSILNPGVNYTFNPNTYALANPLTGNLAVTSSAGAGATGSLSYKIAFANNIGSTLPSPAVTITISGSNHPVLSWTAPVNALYTNIYQNNALIATVPAANNTYSDFGVSAVGITNVSNTTPPVVTTSVKHGLANGEEATISGVVGATQANGTWVIEFIDNLNFSITANVTGVYVSSSNDLVQPAGFSNAIPTANTTGYSPTVNSIDSVNCPDGIYDFEFNYTPVCSRNDPGNTQNHGIITNKIDVFVVGSDIQEATDNVIFNLATLTNTFNNTPGSSLYYRNFKRPDGSYPLIGDYLLPLTFAPVLGLPDVITIGASGSNSVTSSSYRTIGSTIVATDSGSGVDTGGITAGAGPQSYALGSDYFLVNDITSKGGSPQSLSGIEFSANPVSGQLPPTGSVNAPITSILPVTYNYNALPAEVEQGIENWRVITNDVWVHQAQYKYLTLNMILVLNNNQNLSSLQNQINSAIQTVFNTLSFDSILSTSSILSAVGSLPGVVAVRFATSADNSESYAIQEFSSTGALLNNYVYNSGGTNRAIDIYFDDDTVPIFNDLNITLRALNTFQSGA